MRDAAGDWHGVRIAGYDVVRIVLGLVLLTAAALKGHQLATEPVAGTGLLTSRWFLIGVVEFELFFGLWLLSGLYPSQTWQLALLCFTGFACISLYKGLSGEACCGCFGRVPVNPWYTLVLDLAAVAALLGFRPAGVAESSPRPLAGEGPGVRAGPRRQVGWVLAAFLAAGIPAALAMASYQAATLDEAGDIFGDSEFVVLEPEQWISKQFPLLKYIDIGDRLAEGKWIVVLYHHDCPHCEEAISKYEKLARVSARQADTPRVAVVEMPPYAGAGQGLISEDTLCTSARLSDMKEWYVETPLVLSLGEARVTAVIEGVRKRST